MNKVNGQILDPDLGLSQKFLTEKNDGIDFNQNFTDRLWHYTESSKRPIWTKMVNIIFWPLDITVVKLVYLAFKKIPELNFLREATNREECIILDSQMIDSSIQDCYNIAQNWLNLSPDQLKKCMTLISETRQKLQERNWICLQKMRRLNSEFTTPFVVGRNSNWRLDPVVFSHVEWGRLWVEKMDKGSTITQTRNFKKLKSNQVGELSICLRLVDLLYNMKKMERATASYVHYRIMSIGFLKLAFLLSPLLVFVSRHRIKLQIGFSLFSSTYLAVKSFRYYLKSTDTFDEYHDNNFITDSFLDLTLKLNELHENYELKVNRRNNQDEQERLENQIEEEKRTLEILDFKIKKTQMINEILKKLCKDNNIDY